MSTSDGFQDYYCHSRKQGILLYGKGANNMGALLLSASTVTLAHDLGFCSQTLSHSSLSVDTDWFRVACAPFLDAAYVPKLKIAICCTVQCRVVAVDVKAKVMKYDIPAAALITSLGWKFDDGRLVLGDVEGKIYFWDSLASFSRAGRVRKQLSPPIFDIDVPWQAFLDIRARLHVFISLKAQR